MANDNTYWNNKGKYQSLNDKLSKLIPHMGSVNNPEQNPALENLRIAGNCYYDLFNNGLCNRADEFRKIFKFNGTWIAKKGFPYHEPLERKMDEFIVLAGIEQGLFKEVD